jgi:hypothetical protein
MAKILGFRSVPNPKFEDIDIKDAVQFNRIYTRLIELGILTPAEGVEAIETGRLPDHVESVESQEIYKELKNQGFYEPLTGGPFTQEKIQTKNIHSTEKINTQNLRSNEKISKEKVNVTPSKTTAPNSTKKSNNQKKKTPKENGRPAGTGTPQSTKNVKPIGSPGYGFSISKIKENMILAQKLESEVQSKLKEKHNIKRISKKQKEVSEQISHLIIANESPKNWLDSIEKYCNSPVDQNQENITEIQNLAFEHQLDYYLASILYASKCNIKHEEN